MRWFLLLTLCSVPATAQSGQASDRPSQPPAQTFPLQLEMRVPFEPTAFPSEGRTHLFYELHLTNFAPVPLSLNRIDALDADAPAARPVAGYDAPQLENMFQLLGGKAAPKGDLSIPGGRTAVVFVEIAFDHGSDVPKRLVHRVRTAEGTAQGAVIGTHHTPLHRLGPPLEGSNWLAADGPSNDPDNHHRRGLMVLDGRAIISRRYAIDWKQVKDGASFSGDPRDPRSYYSYGKTVLAVEDGIVVTARDGLPDNVPGHNEAFHPAVPITLDTVAGNTITLDLGGGQFAYYMHLEPGSLLVKTGDRVRRGQVLARVGCSGDAREPHLHFEVTDTPNRLAGEGLPYLIDRYRGLGTGGGASEVRVDELPVQNTIAAFGEEQRR